MQPRPQHGEHLLAVSRFGGCPRRGLDALLAVALHRLGRHRDDRQRRGSDCRIMVSMPSTRHDVHQYDIVSLASFRMRMASLTLSAGTTTMSCLQDRGAQRCSACRRPRRALSLGNTLSERCKSSSTWRQASVMLVGTMQEEAALETVRANELSRCTFRQAFQLRLRHGRSPSP